MPSRQMNVSNTQKRIWDEAVELQFINVQMALEFRGMKETTLAGDRRGLRTSPQIIWVQKSIWKRTGLITAQLLLVGQI